MTGFVPGQRDALTGQFVVRERDAHAWAEIYFPGVGWQGFDPTASVPLAGDATPSGSWLSDGAAQRGAARDRWPCCSCCSRSRRPEIVGAVRRRRAPARVVERRRAAPPGAGRAQGGPGPRAGGDAAGVRAARSPSGSATNASAAVGDTLDADLYSAHGAPEAERADADAVLTSLRP